MDIIIKNLVDSFDFKFVFNFIFINSFCLNFEKFVMKLFGIIIFKRNVFFVCFIG